MDMDEEFEARNTVVAEVKARLQGRGIEVVQYDSPEDLGELLSAVERFEAAVKAHGGDLMVDDLKSAQPDDPHFVLPRRGDAEEVMAYVARIDEATGELRRHPSHPD